MPKSSRYIILEGEFEGAVLGAFQIIRGFANLKELAEISVPYEMEESSVPGGVRGQQRKLDLGHAEKIKRYLESGAQRFMPEVILSVRNRKSPKMSGSQPLGDFQCVKVNLPDSAIDIHSVGRLSAKPMRHQIKIDRRKLDEIHANRLIRRIDGNHRLALAHTLKDDPLLPSKYLASFCMVLLGDPIEPADDYSESLIFHTVNSTALPLESEHALKLILGQNAAYDMKPEKEFAFSPDLYFTRLLRDGLLKLPEPAQSRLGHRPLSCLRAAVRGLLEMDVDVAKDLPTLRKYSKELLAALNDIVTRLEPSQPALCQAEFFIELAARVWKSTPDGKHIERVNATVARLEQLAGWLGKDGLTQLKEGQSLCKQVLDIFNTIRTRIPRRVFLARWYPTAKEGTELNNANLRLKQIRLALRELKEEKGIHLELVDMGTQTGGTFPIHPRMYEAISSAEIILIDLTGVRPNVCVEAGFALRHHEKNRLIFIFEPTKKQKTVPFDLNTFCYQPISNTAEISEKIKPHIEAILRGASIGAS
jgi:hypothetical protein